MILALSILLIAALSGCAYLGWGWLMTYRNARVYAFNLLILKDDDNLTDEQRERIRHATEEPRSSVFWRWF